MEQSNANNNLNPSHWLVITGLLLLIIGMSFGVIGTLQYVVPGFLKNILSFEKIRPLHVSSVVLWILFAATGSVIAYLQSYIAKPFSSSLLSWFQLALFILATLSILLSYAVGYFGGREYWEFPPPLAMFLFAGWILFILQVRRLIKTLKQQPVYIWMWITGAFGFLFTFSESYLWLFDYFGGDIVRDMTVQWKSYGSMVGCWNMLVYGSGIFLMEKISGDRKYAMSFMAYLLFFLGLLNLMFNWSHHIYTLPVASALRHIGYAISMTELFILGRIIYKWRETVSSLQKNIHHLPYRFLMIADFWIFLNLMLAILISIPGINIFTHGTHITVAHAMGTTIGINTMILLATAIDLLENNCKPLNRAWILNATWVVNGSLLLFVGSLLAAGIQKGFWQMSNFHVPFGQMMNNLAPFFVAFCLSGIVLWAGFLAIILPLLQHIVVYHFRRSQKQVEDRAQYFHQQHDNHHQDIPV